ncbi:anaphase-promoting complex subunit 15 [Phlebotomus argentipes]|uniref:anaphase-promoting complex subunit 15 n=1 Tax=Phlebotomus argentipes TaxID=94469 RepID=UPI0028931DFA|nr:anaphase-promoting complex subunit 15 [Phlebotomus argentipes]
MIPFFPRLTPPITHSIWFDVDAPRDEDAEITALEEIQNDQNYALTQVASDISPLGKAPHDHTECPDSDDDANEDSDDEESHDEEEEDEIDAIDTQTTVEPDGTIEYPSPDNPRNISGDAVGETSQSSVMNIAM